MLARVTVEQNKQTNKQPIAVETSSQGLHLARRIITYTPCAGNQPRRVYYSRSPLHFSFFFSSTFLAYRYLFPVGFSAIFVFRRLHGLLLFFGSRVGTVTDGGRTCGTKPASPGLISPSPSPPRMKQEETNDSERVQGLHVPITQPVIRHAVDAFLFAPDAFRKPLEPSSHLPVSGLSQRCYRSDR